MGEAKRRREQGAEAAPARPADVVVSVLYDARLLLMMRVDPPSFRHAMDGLGALYRSRGLGVDALIAAVRQSGRLAQDAADATIVQQRQGAGLTLLWLAFRCGLYRGHLRHWQGESDLVLSATEHTSGLKLDFWGGAQTLPELPMVMH